MNLQPVFPSRPEQTVPCRGHHGAMKANTINGFADLDAKPGTFYCVQCAAERLGYGAVERLLLARDQRELRTEGTLMSKGQTK